MARIAELLGERSVLAVPADAEPLPDPVRGHAVKATIVLNNGYTGGEELVRELQTWVKKRTAPYKYPRIIDFVDALPKTVNGKIRRAAIRDNDAGNREE